MNFDALFAMWQMVIDRFGIAACDKGDTLYYSDELVVGVCWCGMHHAVPRQLRDHMKTQQRDGRKQMGIYCPLGHFWVFGGTAEVDKERKRREAAEARAKAIQDQLDAETRSHSATKGQLTKAKKRVGNGTCPCCNRHFANVERHMANKHPDFGPASPEAIAQAAREHLAVQA